jgi:hypothetical protein
VIDENVGYILQFKKHESLSTPVVRLLVTIPWYEKVEDVKEESWKDIEYNDQKKKDKTDKTRNNELQNTTQKAKDCTTRTHKNLW